MRFEIKNRWTGAVQFDAEIECGEDASDLVRLGLAVKCAVKAGADLFGANLFGANLTGANLTGANLNGISGLNDWIKCIQVEDWPISYTSDVMQIGCQCHTFDAWRNFSDAEIRAMDGRKAVAFWGKWKSVIFQIIEMAPAQTTKDFAQVEASQ